MHYIKSFFILLGISFTMSCDRPECTNTDPVFDRYSETSREYKKELARILNAPGHEQLHFWLEGFQEQDTTAIIKLMIQGKGVCVKGDFLVSNWAGMEGIKEKKGVSYLGAELEGFRFHIVEGDSGVSLICDGVQTVSD